ncbi:hypothetical protein [Sorangium sp. So ce693]|uniref:hypothetical protein n=1 Tax=Sorangium sp. So ce693 TaxID=3133318 RepID=UPI003F5E6C45
MKHSSKELVEVAYRYYPRGVSREDPRYKRTEEYGRLADARRRAGAECGRWQGMLNRIHDKFPDRSLIDRSIHLPTGNYDACYAGHLSVEASAPGEYSHVIGFMVSLLVSCYVVYSLRTVDDLEEIERIKVLNAMPSRHVSVFAHDTHYVLPAWMGKLVRLVKPNLVEPPLPLEARRQDLSFDLSPDEQPYATWIAQEIERTWGYEHMPPLVGKLIIPDVATDSRLLGEATLYDCLFSDSW